MITLITGGSGSGKSAYAEKYICHVSNEKGYKEEYYIATMQIFDDEGQRKIDRHRRPVSYTHLTLPTKLEV